MAGEGGWAGLGVVVVKILFGEVLDHSVDREVVPVL